MKSDELIEKIKQAYDDYRHKFIEYPEQIFGAKMREEKFGVGEEQYVLHCYDIFGGTYSVRVDGYFISSRFDYGEIHSSSFRSRDGFEGFERNAANLVNKVIAYFLDEEENG